MALFLYFDNNKGLVKSKDFAIGDSIIGQDEKGEKKPSKEQVLEIPSQNLKIIVKTNRHFRSGTYMTATVKIADKYVFDFLDNDLGHSLSMVYAKQGDWNMLFDNVIRLYNNIFNSDISINTYFDIIEEAIKSENSCDKMANVVARLAEISLGLSNSIYGAFNETIDRRMKSAFRRLVLKIVSDQSCRYFAERTRQTIEANLHSVFKYFSERKEILEMLEDQGSHTVE